MRASCPMVNFPVPGERTLFRVPSPTPLEQHSLHALCSLSSSSSSSSSEIRGTTSHAHLSQLPSLQTHAHLATTNIHVPPPLPSVPAPSHPRFKAKEREE